MVEELRDFGCGCVLLLGGAIFVLNQMNLTNFGEAVVVVGKGIGLFLKALLTIPDLIAMIPAG